MRSLTTALTLTLTGCSFAPRSTVEPMPVVPSAAPHAASTPQSPATASPVVRRELPGQSTVSPQSTMAAALRGLVHEILPRLERGPVQWWCAVRDPADNSLWHVRVAELTPPADAAPGTRQVHVSALSSVLPEQSGRWYAEYFFTALDGVPRLSSYHFRELLRSSAGGLAAARTQVEDSSKLLALGYRLVELAATAPSAERQEVVACEREAARVRRATSIPPPGF